MTKGDRMRTRRRVLAALAMLAVAPRLGAQARPPALEPTPRDVEGPFYPVRFPADRDGDLTVIAGHAKVAMGATLYLRGQVLDTAGSALPGARVELWQCDVTGHYHHVDGDRPGDPDFQGYGVVESDRDGRYEFKTIKPVAYASRPPHLHFKLSHPQAAPLTTQLYVRGDGDAGDPMAASGGRRTRDRLSIALAPAPGPTAEAVVAQYDFVLVRR